MILKNEHKKYQSIFQVAHVTTALTYHIPQVTRTPWKHLVTCKPLWGLIMAWFLESFIFNTIFTNLPTFIREVMKLDIKTVSV